MKPRRNRWSPSLFALALVIATVGASREWDATTLPNPTAGQFAECGMKTTANICDPDEVLSESARNRLNTQLEQLESQTRQPNATDFCRKKGITGGIAIVKKIKSGTLEAVKAMANRVQETWSLDPQCKKAVFLVLAVDNAKFWTARDNRVPLTGEEINQLFMQQKALFKSHEYEQALINVLTATRNAILAKKKKPANTEQPRQEQKENYGGAESSEEGGSMPTWVIILIIVIIVVAVCAGGGGAAAHHGNSGPNQQVHYNNQNNQQYAHQPSAPPKDEEEGLYPHVDFKDDGGGGSWSDDEKEEKTEKKTEDKKEETKEDEGAGGTWA